MDALYECVVEAIYIFMYVFKKMNYYFENILFMWFGNFINKVKRWKLIKYIIFNIYQNLIYFILFVFTNKWMKLFIILHF